MRVVMRVVVRVQVIKETMRLVPPATGIIRKVGSEDVEYNVRT
jgi:cytochrome P450